MHNNKEKCFNYRHSLRGYLIIKWKLMERRSLNPKRKNILIGDLCDRDSFVEFGLSSPQYQKLHEAWKNSNYQYKICPSVDRIDNNKGYLLNNLQFLTLVDNVNKGHDENSFAQQASNRRLSKKVYLEKDGLIIEAKSAADASRWLGDSRGSVATAICEKRFRVRGWKVSYEDPTL